MPRLTTAQALDLIDCVVAATKDERAFMALPSKVTAVMFGVSHEDMIPSDGTGLHFSESPAVHLPRPHMLRGPAPDRFVYWIRDGHQLKGAPAQKRSTAGLFEFLRQHPKSTVREMVKGTGFARTTTMAAIKTLRGLKIVEQGPALPV